MHVHTRAHVHVHVHMCVRCSAWACVHRRSSGASFVMVLTFLNFWPIVREMVQDKNESSTNLLVLRVCTVRDRRRRMCARADPRPPSELPGRLRGAQAGWFIYRKRLKTFYRKRLKRS